MVQRVSFFVGLSAEFTPRWASTHFLHIRDVDGAVNLFDAAIRIRLGRFGRFFKLPSSFDDNGLLGSIHRRNNATLALVLAGNDKDFIAFLNVGLHRVCVVLMDNPGLHLLQRGALTLLFSGPNVKHNLADDFNFFKMGT